MRVCAGCGSLLPVDSPECIYCGLRSDKLVSAQREADLERNFLGALFNRSSPFTYLFIGINLGVFVLMWLAGGMGSMSSDHEVLIAFGAKDNELIATHHQYWRLITSIFIHIGFLHLLLNNYAFWIVGQEIERIYGSSRFVLLYLATGLCGALASYRFNPEPSAGASGAIFGLFGALATFAFRYRKEIPNVISADIRRRVVPLIAINLVFGFLVAQIDNAAHIGGLISGVALALVIPYKRPQEKATAIAWRVLLAGGLALMVFSFVTAFRNYNGPRPQLANLSTTPGTRVIQYLENMNQATAKLDASRRSFIEILIKRDERAELTQALDAARQGAEAINKQLHPDPEAEQYRKRLRELVIEQGEIIERFKESKPKMWAEAMAAEKTLSDKQERFWGEYKSWLGGFLKKRGLKLVEEPPPNQQVS